MNPGSAAFAVMADHLETYFSRHPDYIPVASDIPASGGPRIGLMDLHCTLGCSPGTPASPSVSPNRSCHIGLGIMESTISGVFDGIGHLVYCSKTGPDGPCALSYYRDCCNVFYDFFWICSTDGWTRNVAGAGSSLKGDFGPGPLLSF